MNILRHIDIFGKHISLNISKSNKINTPEGILLSLIFYLFASFNIFYKFYDAYKTNEPIFQTEKFLTDKSVPMNITS